MVLAHLETTKLPLPVETVIESRPLGTAGAIALARSALDSDPVVLLNGDTWLEIELSNMLAIHRGPPFPLATICCVSVDDTRRYGAVEICSDGGIGRFVEKHDELALSGWVNGGVYFISAQLLDVLSAGCGVSLERDVLPRLPARMLRAYTVSRANFLDIGTPESYARAALHVLARNAKTSAGRQ
jgi:NDP-sugar pyrophosphorylase family protein